MTMKHPTIKQIADMAGVSIATVDRVLHKRGKVKPETSKKIETIIHDLDYSPNIYARNLALGPSMKIAVLMPKLHQDGGYWQLPARGIEKQSENLKPFQVTVEKFEYDKYSEKSFWEVAQQILEQNYNGLLIAPIKVKAARDFVRALPPKMPHVFFDSEVPDSRCLSTIHQNSFHGGRVAAKLFDTVIQDSSTLAIARFLPATFHINERVRGFKSYLEKRQDLKLVMLDVPENSSKNDVYDLFQSLRKVHKNLKGIFVTGSHTFEIAECMSRDPGQKKIYLIGFDLVLKNIEYMRNDVIDFLISQCPELQSYTGIGLLYRHLLFNEDIEKEIALPIEIINKENLDFYLNRRALEHVHYSSF